MNLTPIRIPGKRRRKGLPPVALVIPNRKAKKIEKRKKKIYKPKASYLEKRLPLEIIERIFWMSENVNFARSGLRVGKLLSGQPTRREIILHAFAPTWDVWFGCLDGNGAASVSSYHGWQNDASRFGGNPEFQSALLRYSWANISFILDCMDSWVQRYGKNRFFRHHKLWGDPDRGNILDDDSGGINSFKSARQYFQHDYDAFCSNIDNRLPLLSGGGRWIEVHCETRIPDSLLTGPWSEEGTQKLFWMYRAGARLSDEQTWETTLEGYQHAMATETKPPTGKINLPVIQILFLLGEGNWPEHVVASEFNKLESLKMSLPSRDSSAVHLKYASIASMMIRSHPTLSAAREPPS